MSAEILRRAAALMRERARSSIRDSDGGDVWHVGPADCYGNTPTVMVDVPGDLEAYTVAAGCGDADAEHIASWHPVVALAVADWLDAEFAHQFGPTAEAIDVARAYLGEQS